MSIETRTTATIVQHLARPAQGPSVGTTAAIGLTALAVVLGRRSILIEFTALNPIIDLTAVVAFGAALVLLVVACAQSAERDERASHLLRTMDIPRRALLHGYTWSVLYRHRLHAVLMLASTPLVAAGLVRLHEGAERARHCLEFRPQAGALCGRMGWLFAANSERFPQEMVYPVAASALGLMVFGVVVSVLLAYRWRDGLRAGATALVFTLVLAAAVTAIYINPVWQPPLLDASRVAAAVVPITAAAVVFHVGGARL